MRDSKKIKDLLIKVDIPSDMCIILELVEK